MKSNVAHIYLYVSDLKNSYGFYSKFLTFLDYRETVNKDWGFAFNNGGTSIWFEKARPGYVEKGYHRKRIGLNHLAFRVNSKEEVDKFYTEFLNANEIPTLYETPKPFPEYEEGYYAVYFEDPDRIKLEVAYYP
ncbi:hypothetical protein A2714_03565 [Candidatus Woesebacteria bacterium RIFCSPHIGHO2_01_FULL_38_9]|uniref:VOC domain-containing protein n=2 Tax=Candidatus Woeseibacteriota TaxID=1752722 RepID=A0A1F7Y0B9_9BACT|nr:MAG: hypothetical protein A2714_03565 [Candidatus Woesebacteria bacterium RIFCSPHIGHO2_01_FULL_38_9]OGM63921.1 MAG: hypothetical protein A2893_00200 [Candidatus Woesebacteria bacterium RIFCSPLOWO2_01_FULL_39_25]